MNLPLSDIVSVSVLVNPQALTPPSFNQGLIVGTSTHIPTYGATGRIRLYKGGSAILTAMAADGFLITDPEYLAAQQAVNNGVYYLNIGRQDTTAIETFAIGAGGTNYVVGDQITVGGGGTNGVLQVTTIGGGGVVTGLQFVTQGTAYAVANGVATTGGSGTGLTVNILTIGETPLQAVQACRIASTSWYLFTVLTAADADNIAMVEWAQTATPVCQCFFQTSSTSALNGTNGNIFSVLKTGSYSRYQGIYTTTQSGAAPNNAYMAAALMGLALGLNTGLPGSYFTLTNKTLVGMTVEPLTPTQFATITGNNGNAYCSYGGVYNSYSPGITGNGQYFDQVLNIDMLAADLQYAMLKALQTYKAIGQNDQGQSILIHAANTACQSSLNRGALSSGTWTGAPVLNLQNGMTVPGFINQSQTYAQYVAVNGSKPANRASLPIYCCVNLTEAVQQVVIAVTVQQ